MTYYLRQHVQGSTTSLQAHGRTSTNDGSGSLANMTVWLLRVVFNLCFDTKIKLRTQKNRNHTSETVLTKLDLLRECNYIYSQIVD